AVSEITGSGKNYNVKVNTGSGEGTLKLNVIDDDSIRDANNHPIGGDGADNGTYTNGEEYTIVRGTAVLCIFRVDPNPTVAASVNFAVIFSEYVSGVDPADFSLTTTSSVSGALVTNVSGSGTTYTVTVGTGSGAGDLRLDVVDNDSILNASSSPLGGPGAGNGNFTSGEAYTINRIVPFPTVISSLSSDTNPTNATSIHFDVTFSEAVSGVDLIDFTTVTTGNVSSATVASVSGSGTIYSVTVNLGSGDGTVRLDVLDDDSIVNASNSPLGGPGAGNGNFMGGNYTISQTLAISILRADPDYSPADIVHFNVTFSESVSGVDASDFVLATTGVISSVTVTGVSGSGNTYTVTISTGAGDGTLRIDLIDNDSIINTAGNPLGGVGPGNGNFRLGETYSIDKNAPIMFSSLRLDANPTTATSVRFIVTFSEAVTGVDVNDFALTTTNISGASIGGVEIGVSGFTFIVTVSTGSGNGTLRLDLIDNDSIVDDVNHPLGGVGVGNGSFITGEAYSINNAPTILSASYRSTGSSDGWVLESSENSNLGGSKNSAAAVFKIGDNAQDRQFRSVLHFPTYYLPDNAVVMQAILMIKKQDVIGTDPFTTHQNISIDIRKGYFSNFNLFSFGSLQDTDYQATADMYMVGTIQNNPVSGWYWATLDSRAFPYINLKDVTQLRLAFQLDDNDDLGDDYIRFYSGDYDAQKDRPHLLIEYYVPR
ncbi:MAG: hypothetical protein Q7T89_04770, partial [Anaerolineales bacterium]|nr:hypothetical protein [Anaerolineales bacterium]